MNKLKLIYLGVCSAFAVFTTCAIANESLSESKARCKKDMGQYGASMVKACIDQDMAVIGKINKYAESHPSLTGRCMRDMRVYGFSMVHACIKQDVDAQEAIDNY